MDKQIQEIQRQIDATAENTTYRFIDAYECEDWKISATEFASLLIAEIQKQLSAVAYELDNPDDE